MKTENLSVAANYSNKQVRSGNFLFIRDQAYFSLVCRKNEPFLLASFEYCFTKDGNPFEWCYDLGA